MGRLGNVVVVVDGWGWLGDGWGWLEDGSGMAGIPN